MVRSASLALLALLLAVPPAPAHAASELPKAAAPLPPEPGVWWDITMEMTVRGANVPPQLQGKPHTQVQRECLPKKVPDRLPPQGDDCKMRDFRRSGSRLSVKLDCKDGVTGEAEILWTSDTYAGTTIMRGPGIENRIKLRGKKVGGDCDANAKEREEADRGTARAGEQEEAPPDEGAPQEADRGR